MSILDDIRRDMEAGTPGPWKGQNMVAEDGQPMTPEEIGEYVCNSVKIGEPGRFLFVAGKHADGGDCDVCHTGNGPRGFANTRRIARVPQLEQIALAAEGCANWCDVLIEAVLSTSCAPDDPEAFEDAIRGAQMFAAALRKAMEATE